MIRQETLFLSASELGAKLRARELSPVELAEAYLERSKRSGLNAYATLCEDRALSEARRAEQEIAAGQWRGPLHGVPYAAKDLLATEGYNTEWGARPYRGQRFDFDATVIAKLREAGAVLLGKAAMIELAGGLGYRFANASASGPARNPWDDGCWTCGSSSGSGAVVAGALAAFAIGTETWGSIICPSAYCGVTGLRPTFGRVSRSGAMALSYSMDKIGPMCRTAEDCGLVLEVIAGHDPADRGSLPVGEAEFRASSAGLVAAPGFQGALRARGSKSYGNSAIRDARGDQMGDSRQPMPGSAVEPLRIGWISNQWASMPEELERSLREARRTLESAGCTSAEIELPAGPWEAAAGLIINVEAAGAFQDLIESGRCAELVDDLGKVGGYIAETIPASDYLRALRLRGVLQRKIDDLFQNVDVLAAASLPVAATKVEVNLEQELAFSDPIGGMGNLCGLPAISMPCGFTSSHLPIGLQFVGRAYDDAAVLRAGQLFQARTDWHRRRPA